MTILHKISLKKCCFPLLATGFCIAITWKTEARHTQGSEIYSTLTSDTIPVPKKDTTLLRKSESISKSTDSTHRVHNADSLHANDTIPTQTVDTFSIRFSKDTLDAPIEYEAADSGVLFVKDKKFLLYGKTKTVYKNNTLTAPTVEMNQATNVVTAMNARDSMGNITARAKFDDGSQSFQSDTIKFNFKTQKGLTTNTYTQQADEMKIQASVIKKVNDSTTFARRLIMTTCEYDDPHFGFIANKGKFVMNKIAVTGPIHPEFEGVPIPIYLPFGMFP